MDLDWIFDWDFGVGPRGRGRHRRRGPGRRFFRQGEVRLALLSLLGDEPAHGYELMGRLEDRSGGMHRASAGTVYPVLQQLEDEGLVEIQKIDGRKVCHVTDAGREELARHEEDVERIWRRAHGWKDWGAHPGPARGGNRGTWRCEVTPVPGGGVNASARRRSRPRPCPCRTVSSRRLARGNGPRGPRWRESCAARTAPSPSAPRR